VTDFVKNNLSLIITIIVVAAVFSFLWYQGYLVKIRTYVAETQEELKKATWPSWVELKGSTLLVMITMALLGIFTISVDFLLGLVNNVIR
jgi:preprotein translocase subunit SecE